MVFRSPCPDMERPSCSICDVVSSIACKYADKPAVIESESGRALTYGQLIEGVDRVAAGLEDGRYRVLRRRWLPFPSSTA